MSRVALLGGAYQARSVIANAQRCVNLFPEKNQEDSPVPFTYYQRPGFVPRLQGTGPVRGLYRPASGIGGYAVIGQEVWFIQSASVMLLLGTLLDPRTNNVSMIDNGVTLFLVDGSTNGYQIDLATNEFSQIVDASATFAGGNLVAILDGFMLWGPVAVSPLPGSTAYGSTLENELVFDPLYTAAKNNYPDPLVALAVVRRELYLLGALKSEIWFDAGNTGFPFAELPGASFEHGIVAAYSLATADINLYWLGQDLQGQGLVFRAKGYECQRISNHALEVQIQRWAKAGSLSNCVGYTYQQGGHEFYILSSPTGDQTWAWDESTEAWSQRAWSDSNGALHRDRSNCAAFILGMNLVGDWENGTIYQLDEDSYTDTVNQVVSEIVCVRSFPHISAGDISFGQPGFDRPVAADGRRVQFKKFEADIACGAVPLDASGSPARLSLRWSDDRGNTFGNPVVQGLGAPGEYSTFPNWPGQMGIARDRVFELSWAVAGPAALNGAWVEAVVLNT